MDVIDILKIKLYELKPNEEDIYLSSISRLINAVEYRDKTDINVVKETCALHVKRKEKVSASIPSVKGRTDYYSYEVAPFDSEYLLTAGLDAKNCFRIGGFGEDFFKYCLTSPNAVVVYLKDNDGNKHICPIVRSGNAIHCNGIDPEVKDELKKYAIEALSQCYCDMMRVSFDKDSKENIEVGTITDLHLKEYFKNYKYPSYDLQCTLPLDESCYTDFNKKEIKHYIISQSQLYKENKYYISKTKYFQKRDNNYEFELNDEFDSEHISLIVNSIAYSAIDYMNIPQKEKNRRKRFFKPFDVKNFKYIIGNKDWYIAIDEHFNTISTILPYDKRALTDYLNSYSKVAQMFEKIIGDKVDRKNI